MNPYLKVMILVLSATGLGIIGGFGLVAVQDLIYDTNYLNKKNSEVGETINSSNSIIDKARIQSELGALFDKLGDEDDLNCDTRYQHQSQDNKTASDFIQCNFVDGTYLKCQWSTHLNKGSFNCDWSDLP